MNRRRFLWAGLGMSGAAFVPVVRASNPLVRPDGTRLATGLAVMTRYTDGTLDRSPEAQAVLDEVAWLRAEVERLS